MIVYSHYIGSKELNDLEEIYPASQLVANIANSHKSKNYLVEENGALKLACTCGNYIINDATCQVWLMVHNKELFYRNILKISKDIKNEMVLLFKEGYHRIQTPIQAEYIKWANFIGLKKESTLKNFNKDRTDQYLYVMVK